MDIELIGTDREIRRSGKAYTNYCERAIWRPKDPADSRSDLPIRELGQHMARAIWRMDIHETIRRSLCDGIGGLRWTPGSKRRGVEQLAHVLGLDTNDRCAYTIDGDKVCGMRQQVVHGGDRNRPCVIED